MQDKQAEVTRLMECLEMSKDRFSRLEWHKADFSIDPEEYFSSVVSVSTVLAYKSIKLFFLISLSIYVQNNYVGHIY